MAESLISAMPEPNTPEELKALKKLNKCSGVDVPEVFEAMPPEVKMKEAVAKMALDKCFPVDVLEIFQAMPDEVKTKEAVFKMAFDKCSGGSVPALFKAMPDEVKTKEAVVKMAFDKCSEGYVPELFEAMPDEVKTKETVVKMALKKCVPKLFEAMAAEVQMNEAFAKIALEKCREDVIPLLFRAMPVEVQMNEAVVKMAFDKCYKVFVPELFKAMPDEVKTKEAVVKMAMEKCDKDYIPELFSAMPDEVKANADVVQALFEKADEQQILQMSSQTMADAAKVFIKTYHKDKIPDLFSPMPDEVKKNGDVVKTALKKCSDFQVPQLFSAMPDEVKANADVVQAVLEKCHGTEVDRLFRAMPPEVKTNADVVQAALEQCSDSQIPQLFSAMPDEMKMEIAVVKRAWKKCGGDEIPQLFSAMPDEVKTSDDVVKMFIKKCPDDEIPALFEAIRDQVEPEATPAELQQLKEYVVLAVDGMDALNNNALHAFQTRLPADLQDLCQRKKVMDLPFRQKYKKLLRAVAEVSIIYLVVLGSIEGAVLYQKSAGGKIQNLSDQHWKNKKDFKEVHFEIFDGCVLSAAPQPFDISLPLTSLKLVFVTALFGFISRNLMSEKDNPAKEWKQLVAVGMMVYSVIMIPFSFITLVVHFVQEVSPKIPGSFKKYECFFAMINLAPFQTNYLMFLAQYLAGFTISKSAGVFETRTFFGPVSQKIQDNIREGWHVLLACFSGKFPKVARETLVQPLLHDDTSIGSLQRFKIRSKFILFSLTLAPYLCVEIPFIITHKIPAAAFFFPFIILIISVTGCIFAIVNRDLLRNWRMLRGWEGAEYFDTWLKTVEEAGYIPIVPALWGLLVINQFLTLAPIYWYGGAPLIDSGIMVLVERSVGIYVMVFWTKIMTKWWSAASLVNEIS